jgi:hypothetical protein
MRVFVIYSSFSEFKTQSATHRGFQSNRNEWRGTILALKLGNL